jgi:hypothetical protein
MRRNTPEGNYWRSVRNGCLLTILAMLLLLGLAFSNQIADWLGRVLP